MGAAAARQLPLLAVVLVCTECKAIWEPTSGPVEAGTVARDTCPSCGGWSWVGELADPITGAGNAGVTS